MGGREGVTRIDFPYLMSDRDRHGNERLYVRRHGHKIRIRATPGTSSTPMPTPCTPLPRETSLIAQLSKVRQQARSGGLQRVILLPSDLMRDCPLSVLSPAHVKMLRDRRAAKPGAANNRRKYLSSMFGWAVEHGLLRLNPAREVRRVRYATAGFHTWTVDEVRQYEQRHPIGTKARLALALLLFLGPRRGDVVTLGRQHERDGWLRFVPRKTRYKRLEPTEKPILPILADIIVRSPTGDLTYLVTEYGKPFTAAGFGNWFRERCYEAGLAHCSAHGLRKAGATIAAENGATDRQLMALYDWTSEKQANVYTAAANRKRLAAQAAQLIVRDQTANTEVSTSVSHLRSLEIDQPVKEGGGRSGGAASLLMVQCVGQNRPGK
jgi:integrase